MNQEVKNLAALMVLALVMRLLLINTGTLMIDMNSWIGWSNILIDGGLKNFYLNWSDYLPSYLYFLWLIGKIKIILIDLGFNIPDVVLYKMPAILADLAASGVIYSLTKKYINKNAAVWAFILYAFNPAVFVNSAMWGQIDGLESFLILLTLWLFLENKFYLGSAILAFLTLLKPTGLFIAPVALIILANPQASNFGGKILPAFFLNFKNFKKISASLIIFFATALFLFIPFIPSQYDKGTLRFIQERYEITINQYQYTSINAFNFWAATSGLWKSDLEKFGGISLMNWGLIMFLFVSAASLYFLIKKWSNNQSTDSYNIFLALAIIFLSSFDLLTRAHERHLLLALPFLSILSVYNRKFLIAYAITSFIYLLNLYFSFIWINQGFKEIFSKEIIFLLSGINIVVLFFLVSQFLNINLTAVVKK